MLIISNWFFKLLKKYIHGTNMVMILEEIFLRVLFSLLNCCFLSHFCAHFRRYDTSTEKAVSELQG